MSILVGVVVALSFVRPGLAEVLTNETIPFTEDVFVPCANGGAGEVVHLTGDLHLLVVSALSYTDHITYVTHHQPQGISGVGLTTGDMYRGTGVTQTIDTAPDGYAFQSTSVNNYRIIGQGPDNDFLVHQIMHLTINATGETTVDFDKSSVGCR